MRSLQGQDRNKIEGGVPLKCGNCGKTGHLSGKCFARERKEARVNPIMTNSAGTSNLTCFRCGEKGHIARHCRKSPRKRASGGEGRLPGNELGRSEGSRPTVSSTQSAADTPNSVIMLD